jgi:outer membrane protein TolC
VVALLIERVRAGARVFAVMGSSHVVVQEPALRAALGSATARLPRPAELDVPSVPAEALAQRPDLAVAAREVLAASSDVSQAEAARYPRIALAGSIGAARFESSAGALSGTLWTIGPVSVSLPLFDAGARRANVVAAQARYDEALIAYAAKLRNAVREVEEALIGLQSTAARSGDARTAAENFLASFRATESRYQSGLASLFELEDARRSAVLAQSTLIDLERERLVAWIALYRALGGGWRAADNAAAS